jgi:pilus assembly protein Flp/PilA
MRRFYGIFKDRRGATAVEYGLILAMIFLAMIAGVSRFAGTTQEMWNHVSNEVRSS